MKSMVEERSGWRFRLAPCRIVFRAPLRIRQYVVGGLQQLEVLGMAGFEVVRVEACRQEPIDSVDRVGIGVGADLEKLVIILHRCAHASPKVLFSSLAYA